MKPLMSTKKKKRRFAFANEHVLWSQEKWQTMHFSDESKFLLIGSDGKTYIRRKVGEELSPKCLMASVKFAGWSVMAWGMIPGNCVGPLVRLQGKLNTGVYKQLLRDHVLPVLRNSTKQPSIFRQDNAPCHKVMVVMNFLKGENVSFMDWPPQGPDLNPTENERKAPGERSKARNPKTTEQLWNALQEEWNKVTRQDINELISHAADDVRVWWKLKCFTLNIKWFLHFLQYLSILFIL